MKAAALLALVAAVLAGCGQAASPLTAAPSPRALAFVLAGGRLQTHEVDSDSGGFRLLASAEAAGCDRLHVEAPRGLVFCSVPSSDAFRAFRIGADGAMEPDGSRLAFHPFGRFVVHPTGRWLLAVEGDARTGDGEVVSYRIGEDGRPAARSRLRAADVREIEMDPHGRFVWGLGADEPTIWAASFDGATGALQAIEREPAGRRPMDLELAGRFLYVANRDSDDVWGYELEPSSGALHAIGRVAQLDRAQALAADPSGRFVYVVGRSIFAFRRGEDGRLQPQGSAAAGRAVVIARWTGAAS